MPFISSSPLFRRDVLVSAGGYNESLRNAEDAELIARLVRAGYVFDYVRTVGIGYRRNIDSMVTLKPGHNSRACDRSRIGSIPRSNLAQLSFGPSPWPHETKAVALAQLPLAETMRYLALLALIDPDRAFDLAKKHLPVPNMLEFPSTSVVVAKRSKGQARTRHPLVDAESDGMPSDTLKPSCKTSMPTR